jgi:hypothetical protein
MSESTNKIILGQIYIARDAWKAVNQLLFPVKVSYKLSKYIEKINTELTIIEKRRLTLLYAAAGKDQSEPSVTLTPNTPEFDSFVLNFNEDLQTESDLPIFDQSLETLLETLPESAKLSADHCTLLEPFFKKS